MRGLLVLVACVAVAWGAPAYRLALPRGFPRPKIPADNPLNPPTYPVHPTEIYDALLNLILYLTLAWLFRRAWKSRMEDRGWKIEGGQRVKSPSSILHPSSSFADGQIFALYLIGYAICRSTVEFFRGDYPADHLHAGLTSAQLVSIPIFVAGLALMFFFSHRARQNKAEK